MQPRDTRERLLDAAEQLFAECGIEATSLRTITAQAEANLASVNYHFGSKEELVKEVFARRVQPINQERLRLLDRCEAQGGHEGPDLECVIRAFIAPTLRLRQDPEQGGEHVLCLMGRIYSEPVQVRKTIFELFDEVIRRFPLAMGRILPDLPADELMWRLHFMVGAMAQTAMASETIKGLTDGLCDPGDVEGTIERLTTFVAAGLRAPATANVGEKA